MEILNSLPEDFIAKKILLIDDDRDFVEINRITLKNRGYDVVTADNGKDGLLK
jgi:ActR/RegA family two-component response regulator